VGVEELRDSLRETDEVEITVTGRISGRESTRPVWFVEEGESLYLVPVTGSDSNWYRNLLKTPRIRVAARGSALTTDANPIEDAARVRDVIDKFRAKYGAEQVRAYYPKQDAAVAVPLVG
jgi:deazaflavin-dependent oxidoreductase (nitroreductase family)